MNSHHEISASIRVLRPYLRPYLLMIAVAVIREIVRAIIADVGGFTLVGGEKSRHCAVRLLHNRRVRCELVYLGGVLDILHEQVL